MVLMSLNVSCSGLSLHTHGNKVGNLRQVVKAGSNLQCRFKVLYALQAFPVWWP